ncbi:glycoside hydrolase family 27 protein [Cylindrobasidium torrendii FP15055 ss-10]|uniref:Alpha-galactosidase n=1 Tax=Cylindrobasidium torrendii FP15055 ss-10 TaxID=1314674 RepID=A0A0D7BSB1_9AGAR|nr:glycoside hydrolase family 27 protein [Cylindrobasidium torrendii FP15055 ss-10]
MSAVSRVCPTLLPMKWSLTHLPVMGYNTWNAYWCNINETLIEETAELMVDLGLRDAGYTYVGIDDCYSEKQRNEAGDIVANKERFPSGMRPLTDKIHDLGMKAGIYGDSGWFTCQYYPGSYQNEERDARTFREDWGFDLLKFDNCAVPFDDVIREGMIGKFSRMSTALKKLALKTDKPQMLFSLCQWGRLEPWLWARDLGQTWRTTDDIDASWRSIAAIINENSFISWASNFYGHNDMDILEVGNAGLSYEESKTHFTAWAFMKSPLLIGTHLKTISEETLSIFKNSEIIGINQDSVVGTGVTPFRWGINPDRTFNQTHPAQYWSGNSENGTIFMMINTLDEPADLSFSFSESPWARAGAKFAIRDLWTHTENGTYVRNFTAHAVPAHGVVALLAQDVGDEPEGIEPRCSFHEWWSDNWCIDQNGTHVPN